MLLPEHVKALIDAGHTVTVERWPDRCVPDKDYEAINGVMMADMGTWPLSPKEAIILGLKELPPRPYLLDHHHLYFAHCYKDQDGWQETSLRFAAGEGTLWDLEFLRDANNKRAAAFGVAAGYVGAALGYLAWACQRMDIPLVAKPARTFKELAKRVHDTVWFAVNGDVDKLPHMAVIAPRGRCGRGAIQCALDAGLPDETISKWDRKEIGTCSHRPRRLLCVVVLPMSLSTTTH